MHSVPPMKRGRRSPSPTIQQQQQHLPTLSLSILGVEPLDEFIKEVADFVHHMIMSRSQEIPNARVRVEANIGVLRERASGQRLALPVLVETILSPNFTDIRFESNMSAQQHKHFNQLLNQLKSSIPIGSSLIDHSHHLLVDSFFDADKGERIRVTRDEGGTVLETMKNIRLGDLNIYNPKRDADWRISVNLEIPVPHPVGAVTLSRRKNMLSYSHEEFKIDLTEVTLSSPHSPPQLLHELELEIARSELVLSTATMRNDPKVSEHERGAFDELIRAFVNNARILVKNTNGGWNQEARVVLEKFSDISSPASFVTSCNILSSIHIMPICASLFKRRVFDPEDWRIIEASPGPGRNTLQFSNIKTGDSSWVVPKGATPVTVLSIPGASNYWSSAEEVKIHFKALANLKFYGIPSNSNLARIQDFLM